MNKIEKVPNSALKVLPSRNFIIDVIVKSLGGGLGLIIAELLNANFIIGIIIVISLAGVFSIIYDKLYKKSLKKGKNTLLEKIEIINESCNIRDYDIVAKIDVEVEGHKDLALGKALQEALSNGADAVINLDISSRTEKGDIKISPLKVKKEYSPSFLDLILIFPIFFNLIGIFFENMGESEIKVDKHLIFKVTATAIKFTISKEEFKLKFTEEQAYNEIKKINTLYESELMSKEEYEERKNEIKKKRQAYFNYLKKTNSLTQIC